MSDNTPAIECLTRVLSAFGMGSPERVQCLGGTAIPKYDVHVPQGRFVVRMRPGEFAAESMIRFDHESLWRLAEHGLPVPCPQRRPDGTSWLHTGEGVFELLSWVEGEPFREGDRAAIESLGTFLARFHSVLSEDIPSGKEGMLREDHPSLLMIYVKQLGELCRTRDERREVERLAEQLEMVTAVLDHDLYPRLPKAVIHGDIHPGNVKFKESQVAAVYDFDYLSEQARCRDLVDALMFFAADRRSLLNPDDIHSLTQPFALDLERSSVLLAAYQQVARLSELEWSALPWLMRSQWVQIRLRGSRKVPQAEKKAFVLNRFFEIIDWLDNEAACFFRCLEARTASRIAGA